MGKKCWLKLTEKNRYISGIYYAKAYHSASCRELSVGNMPKLKRESLNASQKLLKSSQNTFALLNLHNSLPYKRKFYDLKM